MGVIYHVEPLDDEMAALLEEMGATVPQVRGAARNPTLLEVRSACGNLPGFDTRFNVKPRSFWQAVIEGKTKRERDAGTILNVEKFKDAEDQPHAIWFEKGSPALILEIVKRLSKHCGPLVVMPDTGDAPIAVTTKTSIKELLDE